MASNSPAAGRADEKLLGAPGIDRKRLLIQRLAALKASRDLYLSPETRALAKKAADHAEVALGLMDAILRKAQAGQTQGQA